MINIAITGAGGRMGKALIEAVAQTDGLQLSAAIERPDSSLIGVDSGELAGIGRNQINVVASLQEVIDQFDVLIDFSTPASTSANIALCAQQGKKIVVGTTGFDEQQLQQINKLNLYEKIYVLDNQYCDKAALSKSIILADNNEKVFIWPKELKQFKDFNDVCVIGNKNKIKPEFILKNTHSGLKAKLLLTEIKNYLL